MYLLQIMTDNPGLQLKTEVTSSSVHGLQIESTLMVKLNPVVKGMTYRIFEITRGERTRYDSKFLKAGTISH